MRRINVLSVFTVVVLSAALMSAQATRTWVSGVGDDANPCSRTAPCKTFAGAIAKTAPGGEIDALDPGGFGALTITKSITLDGGGGQVASVLVAGTNGIVVAAGPTDIVIIRNMRLDGLLGNGSNSGNAGLNGIRFLTGKELHIQNCAIFGFSQNGIDIEPSSGGGKVIVSDSFSMNNAAGLFARGSSGNTVTVDIDNSHFDGNLPGLGSGVWIDSFATGNVNRSVASGNASKGFVASAGSGGTAELDLYNSSASGNTVGVQSGIVGGGTNLVRVSGNFLNNNGTGFVIGGGGGTISSYGNNYNSNGISGGTLTAAGPQ